MTDTRRLPRTLVVRLDSAGDVLLAGPAVRAVAAGSSHTAMLCGPRGVQAAKLLPGVDEVLEYDAPWVGLEPAPVSRAATRQLLQRLTAGCFDRALVLVSYHQSPLPIALLLKLAGVGWTAADSEDYPGALLDLRHRRLPHRHEALAALDLARDAGFALPPGDEGALRVTTPPDTTHLTGSEPYVVLHPGAAVPARAWSPERAARAAAALAAEGYRVVVTGGRGERELTAKVAGSHGLDLGGLTDLRQLAGVLAGARVAVVGNTGPAHLAAAVGTPVASLFAPVVPAERWAPYGVPHVLLGDQGAACASTRARHCPVQGHPCLDGVSDAEVLAAVAALGERRPTATHDADRTRKTDRADLATDASPGPRDASRPKDASGPDDVSEAEGVPGPGDACGPAEDVSGPGRGPETERGATV